MTVHVSNETPRALRQAIGRDEPFTGRFDLPLEEDDVYLGRTSPIVEGLAGWTLNQAIDPWPAMAVCLLRGAASFRPLP